MFSHRLGRVLTGLRGLTGLNKLQVQPIAEVIDHGRMKLIWQYLNNFSRSTIKAAGMNNPAAFIDA